METRFIQLFNPDDTFELRIASVEAPNRLVGYAARFDSLSVDLGGFKEKIIKGAFRTALTGSADVRALIDHDSGKLLGRTSNGTLRIAEDDHGLRVEIDLPTGVTYADDIRALVQRGDVRGMSFGFKVREGGQKFHRAGGQIIREISDCDLREVSVVSTPAYRDTSIAVRSCQIDKNVLTDNLHVLRPNFARAEKIFRRTLVEM